MKNNMRQRETEKNIGIVDEKYNDREIENQLTIVKMKKPNPEYGVSFKKQIF